MNDENEKVNAPRSRRRSLQQMGVVGVAGMSVPLLGKTAVGATTMRAQSQSTLPTLYPWEGATVFPASGQGQYDALQNWSGLVYPIGIGKVYFGPEYYPTSDPTVHDYTRAGAQVILCYKPTYHGATLELEPTPEQLDDDLASMVASIKGLIINEKATVAAVTIWNEPETNGLNDLQYTTLYQHDYQALSQVATVVCCFAGDDPGNVAGYFPQGFTDGIAVDYYGHSFLSGKDLSNWTSVAQKNGIGFGIWESGDTAAAESKLAQSEFADYTSAMQTTLDDWISHGRKFLGYLWWQDNSNPNGVNIIVDPSDFRIPYLQALQESLS